MDTLNNTILIIEDDPGILELLTERIQELGYSSKGVTDAQKALNWLNENTPFLILLDYSLPDMNGYEFIIDLFNSGKNIPPFIVATGQGDEKIAVEMMKLGARDYIIKDFNYLEMIGLILSKIGKELSIERKLLDTEKELAESNLRNSQIIENVNEGIIVFNNNLEIQSWNPFLENLTEIKASDIKGQQLETFFPFLIDLGIPELLKIVLQGDQPLIELDFPFVVSNSKKNCWVSFTISPLTGTDGYEVGLISTVRDISERKRAEIELVAAKEKAEEGDNLKTAFLNNISHELRTPMNAILGFSNFLIQERDSQEKREMYRGIIEDSCNKLLDIITNIIDISHVQSNQLKLVIDKMALKDVLEEKSKAFKQIADNKDIKFSISSKIDNLLVLHTDTYKLKRTLSHLIDNALKFTYKGEVSVECTQPNPDFIEFSVSDTGIGISKEMQTKVFEPFRQAEGGAIRTFGGPGIGLSIAKAYIELMGGKIGLKSTVNLGTTIRFSIPINYTSENNYDSLKNKEINLANKTILIAENNMQHYSQLVSSLSSYLPKIIHVKNGIEAIDKCRNQSSIDLVIMNIEMPDLDGCTSAQQIKSFRPDLFIIGQTDTLTDDEKNKLNGIVFDDYLPKPINLCELKKTISRFIG